MAEPTSGAFEGLKQTLSILARKLMDAQDIAGVGAVVCQTCESVFQPDCFLFTERLPESDMFQRIMATDTIDGEKIHYRSGTCAPQPYKTLADLHAGRALVVNRDPDSNECFRVFGSGRRSMSLLYAPMMLEGVLFGVVSVQSYTPGRYGQDDLDLLKFIAELAAPAFKRIQTREELIQSRERFRHAIELINAVPYERYAAEGAHSYFGDGIQELTGYSLEELTPERWRQMSIEIHPAGELSGLSFQEAFALYRNGKVRNWKAESRIRTKDGRIRWIRDTGVGLHDENGIWKKTLGILQDITEERKNQQLRDCLAQLGVKLSAVTTAKEAATVVSEAADSILGWDACFVSFYSEEEEKSYTLLMMDTINGTRMEFPQEYARPNDPGRMYLKTLMEGAQLVNQEDIATQLSEFVGDKSQMSASLLYAPIRERGNGIGVISVQSYTPHAYSEYDLSVLQLLADYGSSALMRTKMQDRLRDKDDRYRAAITYSNAVPYERDYLRDVLEFMSDGIESITGYSSTELTLAKWTELVVEIVPHGEVEGMSIPEATRKAHDGEINNWKADYKIRTKDGKLRWVSDSSVTIRDEHGRVTGTLGIIHDITDRVRSEQMNRLLSGLGLELSAAQSSKEVAHVLARAADELVGFDCLFVTIYSAEDDTAYNIVNFDTDDQGRREFPSVFEKPQPPTVTMRRTLSEGAFILNRGMESTLHNRLLVYGNMDRLSEAMIFVPIRKSGNVNVGIMAVQSYTSGAYNEESLRIIQVLADHGSGALERTFAEERLRQSEARNAALATLAHELNNSKTPHEAGLLIARTAKQLIGWHAFSLNLYSESEGKMWDVLNIDTIDGSEVEFPLENMGVKLSTIARKVTTEGAFMVLRKAEELMEGGSEREIITFGEKTRRSASMLYAPARVRNVVTAMLTTQSYKLNAYTEKDLQTLQILADNCGGALERIAMEENLRKSEERYALAAQGANDGLWDWDLTANRIYYSPRLKEMLGYCEELTDKPQDWFSRVHAEDLPVVQQELEAHLNGNTSHFQNEHRIQRHDSSWCWVLCRALAVRDSDGSAVRIAGSMTDISDRRTAEQQLEKAAFYDSLTGLANRALFMDRLEHCLSRTKRKPNECFAVLFMDIDRFKVINDSMGHMVGDKLLQEISRRLERNLRDCDTIARLGGDEFTVLLEDHRDTNQALRIAERLLEEFNEPFRIDGNEIFANASIGIAASSTGYSRVDEILRDADTALYRAKELGRGRCIMFDHKMHDKVSAYLNTESGLRNALKNNEFCLHYQPIICINTGVMTGLEALIRWNKPGHGMIAPNNFIPVAEETGLIVPIGEWVMRTACRQMAEWGLMYPSTKDMFISVNLSARQFSSTGFGFTVDEILRETALDPKKLHVEITETAILKEPENVRVILENWRTKGIRVLLDDFGTGFSPLTHLVNIPVDYIKIDRRFVGLMNQSADSQHMVRAVLSIARVFNLSVIAEGAETEQQMDALRDLHCEYAQGYFISRPIPPEEIEARYLALVTK